jgi:hypothetical protein
MQNEHHNNHHQSHQNSKTHSSSYGYHNSHSLQHHQTSHQNNPHYGLSNNFNSNQINGSYHAFQNTSQIKNTQSSPFGLNNATNGSSLVSLNTLNLNIPNQNNNSTQSKNSSALINANNNAASFMGNNAASGFNSLLLVQQLLNSSLPQIQNSAGLTNVTASAANGNFQL